MGTFIIKMRDYYLEWSTVMDAPVTFGMSLPEFKKYYRAEYGRWGMEDLEGRLERVEEHGSSARLGFHRPPELFHGNCAGPDESELAKDEIFTAYCLREPIRNGWLVPSRKPSS